MWTGGNTIECFKVAMEKTSRKRSAQNTVVQTTVVPTKKSKTTSIVVSNIPLLQLRTVMEKENLKVEMSKGRSDVSVVVIEGIIYAIGGFNELGYCKTVKAYRPSDGFWTRVADLHIERICPEVVTLHGLIYVMGGRPFTSHNDSLEVYNPKTNTWILLEFCIKCRGDFSGAFVIDGPP